MYMVSEQSFENVFFTNYTEVIEVETKSGKKTYVKGYITTPHIDLANECTTDNCMKSILNQLKSGRIKLDVDHEIFKKNNCLITPAGRIVEAEQDKNGILVTAEINDDSPASNTILANLKNRMFDAFSIAFKPVKTIMKQIGDKTVKMLDDIYLLNVALTGNPINPNATIDAVFMKSLNKMGDTMEEENKVEAIVETKSVEAPKVETPKVDITAELKSTIDAQKIEMDKIKGELKALKELAEKPVMKSIVSETPKVEARAWNGPLSMIR